MVAKHRLRAWLKRIRQTGFIEAADDSIDVFVHYVEPQPGTTSAQTAQQGQTGKRR